MTLTEEEKESTVVDDDDDDNDVCRGVKECQTSCLGRLYALQEFLL